MCQTEAQDSEVAIDQTDPPGAAYHCADEVALRRRRTEVDSGGTVGHPGRLGPTKTQRFIVGSSP